VAAPLLAVLDQPPGFCLFGAARRPETLLAQHALFAPAPDEPNLAFDLTVERESAAVDLICAFTPLLCAAACKSSSTRCRGCARAPCQFES
jgi:hypothetical protein